jgi:ParE toxin of type II toxin-antitoxin system, parDE
MRIVYLSSAVPDLRWFKRYYTSIFPEGRARADQQFLLTQVTLRTNPFVGHRSDKYKTAFEYRIARAPFSLIYRIEGDSIQVLRLLDGRPQT